MQKLTEEQAVGLLKRLNEKIKLREEEGTRKYTKEEEYMFSRGCAVIADDIAEVINECIEKKCPEFKMDWTDGDNDKHSCRMVFGRDIYMSFVDFNDDTAEIYMPYKTFKEFCVNINRVKEFLDAKAD